MKVARRIRFLLIADFVSSLINLGIPVIAKARRRSRLAGLVYFVIKFITSIAVLPQLNYESETKRELPFPQDVIMELKINIDLEAVVAQALAPERLQPILDKHISAAITSAIDDATGYRSDFRNRLKEQLATAMPHGLTMDDMAKFQHVLNQSMANLASGLNTETINAALAKVVADVLPNLPGTVTLSDLLKDARADFHADRREAFYAHFERSEYGGGWLALDGDPNCRSEYSAGIRLGVNSEGEVFSLRLDGKDVTPASRPDVINRFDATLMSMYVGRTRLEMDMEPDDVEYAAAEQYDD